MKLFFEDIVLILGPLELFIRLDTLFFDLQQVKVNQYYHYLMF